MRQSKSSKKGAANFFKICQEIKYSYAFEVAKNSLMEDTKLSLWYHSLLIKYAKKNN